MKPEKIIIIGASGSGKSTVARQLSAWWDIPVVHLDKLSWKEGWIRASNEEFDSLVEQELAKDKWIMDGNFPRTEASDKKLWETASGYESRMSGEV